MYNIKKPYEKYVNFLTGVNVIFNILSLCIVGFGILLEVGAHVLEPLFDLYIKKIKQTYSSAGFDETIMSSFNSAELLHKLSIPVIALGAYSLLLAVLGTIAAKRKFVILLIVYSIVVTVGLLLQGFSLYVIFASRAWIDERLKPFIISGLNENYRGYNETDLFSQSFNIVMLTLHCCGVNDYTDFNSATHWRRKLFQDGWWFQLKTPLTCCNLEKKDYKDFACAVNPSDSTSYYLQGCYEVVWQMFNTYKGFILPAYSFLMAVQLSLISASILLVIAIRKRSRKKYEDQHQSEICTSSENGLGHSMRNGLLNHLPFTGLSGELNTDTFQQRGNMDNRRFSVLPDLLAQFLMGTSRFNQSPSTEYGLQQSRMPSFDFGIPYNRTQSFDFGIPSFEFCRPNHHQMSKYGNGNSHGPIIVNLPHPIEPALKAITNIQEIPSTSSEPTADVVTSTKKDSKAVSKFQRCKSENCINMKRQSPETSKSILNRQNTCPNGLQSVIIKEEEEQQD